MAELSPGTGRGSKIESVVTIVPVRNEQDLLERLISSLREAQCALSGLRPEIEVSCVFALDRCEDGSEAIIRRHGYTVVGSRDPGVGAARRAAADRAIARARRRPMDTLWLANTDADSVVPWNWYVHQVDLADAGADLVIGTVRPVPGDLDPERWAAWEATHESGLALGHVHGANLGIRASTYRLAQGFQGVCEHEDVDLVERAMDAGADGVASNEHPVLTSGRLLGRSPGGYAGYLREQLLPLADSLNRADPLGEPQSPR